MASDDHTPSFEAFARGASSHFALIIEHSPNEIYVLDAVSLRYLAANEAARKNSGYTTDELRLLTPLDLSPEITPQVWDRLVRPLREGHRTLTRFNSSHQRKDGSSYPVAVQLEFSADQTSAVFIASIEDLTDCQSIEAGQKVSAAVLATVIDTAPDAIIMIDAQGTIESFSAAAEKMLGYRADEVIGQNVKMLMPNPYRDEHDGYMEHYLQTGEKRVIGIGRQVIALRQDGTEFPMELAVGEVNQGGKRLFTGFIRDISSRVEMEERTNVLQRDLNHAARLTAMGEMASALAHEINQPLAAISNYAQVVTKLLSKEPDPDKRLIDFNTKIAEQAQRAGDIIRHLRQFVRRGEAERRSHDVNEVVREAAQMALVGAASRGISVKFNLQKNLVNVDLDRIQIQQVVVNLVRNAMDSFQDAVSDESGLRSEHLLQQITICSEASETKEIHVSILDSGPGIAESILGQLFEPFATTKEAGMGIGLSVSKSIMEAHGGRLWAENNPDGGAVFHFSLPIETERSDHGG